MLTRAINDKQRRRYQRFRSVGMARLYSPAAGGYLDGVAQLILNAALHDMSLTGLSFDVSEAFELGELLYVEAQQTDQHSERFKAEVRWCEALPAGGYRVGVKVTESGVVERDRCESGEIVSLVGAEFPIAVDMSCPACNESATFSFVSTQGAVAGGASMPLYNCSACGTTRSLAGMLIQQRRDLFGAKTDGRN